MTLDLHGMSLLEAKKFLEKTLVSLPKDIKEITVIHGYSQGDAILKMVRDPNQLRHRRIIRRRYTKNKGETILVLL